MCIKCSYELCLQRTQCWAKAVLTLVVQTLIQHWLNVSCLMFLENIMYFLDGTIQGKVDFTLHYCYDPAADSFRDLPMNACKEINEAFDLEVWGVLLKSTFARADGVICTTDQSESNHPMGELNPQVHLVQPWCPNEGLRAKLFASKQIQNISITLIGCWTTLGRR